MDIILKQTERLNGKTMETILISSAICGSIWFVFKLYRNYSFFTDRGIPGPRPIPLIGHLHKFTMSDMGEGTTKTVAEYGRICGLYFGLSPRLVVAEAETVKQICIKDFDAFTDHFGFELINEYQKNFIFLQKGDNWRRNRIFMSPTFTSGKIRQMYKMLDVCARDLIEVFEEQLATVDDQHQGGKIINAKELFNLYTLDAIATCCYGLKMERTKDSQDGADFDKQPVMNRNSFAALCMKIFKFNQLRILPEVLGPTKLLKYLGYHVIPKSRFEPIADIVRRMLKSRRNNKDGRQFHDYLQMLVDAKIDDRMELGESDLAENHYAGLTNESLRNDQNKLLESIAKNEALSNISSKKLTEQEIVSNAFFLLFVGLETTATVLSSCVYALAFNQDIQDKLYEEIKQLAKTTDQDEINFDYDALTASKYLDAVISETIRISPIVPMVDRVANRDYHFDKLGFSIPKGSILFIGISALHHDPEYWPEPNKFDPERFMPENKDKIVSGSYCPFGIGPRHCVGMRFSLTETKIALARIIMRFRFDSVPGLKFPAQRVVGFTPGGLRDPRVILRERCAQA